jgi:hypothetical protein
MGIRVAGQDSRRLIYRWRAEFESSSTINHEDGLETILRTVQKQGKLEVASGAEALRGIIESHKGENIIRLELERVG